MIQYPTFIDLVESDIAIDVDGICEDNDPFCPYCAGRCTRESSVTLHRIDMADATGTAFCVECSEDALESGVFVIEAQS